MTVEAIGIGKTYSRGTCRKAALSGVSLFIPGGGTLFVLGRSGSGKTTLLSLLGLLDRPDSGEILYDGIPVTGVPEKKLALLRRNRIGFIYQNFNLVEALSVLDNILLPLVPSGIDARLKRRAVDLADRLGIRELLASRPGEISGGESQRAAIARALLREPELLLADEPTGSLDSGTGECIMDLIRGVSRERKISTVIVTHERSYIGDGDRVLILKDGTCET